MGPHAFCLTFALVSMGLLLAGCQTVTVQADDKTGPTTKLEITGILDDHGNPDPVFNDSSCCNRRRSVPDLAPLTIAASAEDPESGVRDIAVWIWAIKRCRYDDSTGDFQITQSTVAAAGTASGTYPPGSSAPLSRSSTATVRMADTPYGACNPKTVTDASGQTRVVAAQPTGFCGRRVFIVTQNGNAYQGSSKGVLFTTGPFGSNNQPCNEIPN
ncbi:MULTISPECIES: hypothetical protein [unclassified Ensifer]|uniref:hypothetical protein n=1 Tax=unclassified Ensifer TaxID=2633371 RepID=UPI0013AFCFFA|nr:MULTISPECIES: hypothetical protein [unclassified Ensifer]MBD9494449.1 hypothetical protein [Ensifer sp. ENS01]MBD9518480.1 hypothetical protein [Ensifer sp. ENS02]